MGEAPSFMSGVYDVLEKYLDPEYQMRLRAEKEEQKRYENERRVEADRYDKELQLKLTEYNYNKNRQDEQDKIASFERMKKGLFEGIDALTASQAPSESISAFVSDYKSYN